MPSRTTRTSPEAAAWSGLDRELAAWQEAGQVATFWWRDDDATAPDAALDRLLEIAGAAAAPVALAVIPAGAEPAIRNAVPATLPAAILQHGYAHRNHAPPEAKKAELGPNRPTGVIAAELAEGRRRLRALFGERFHPVLVPPWNRIDPALVADLPRLGFSGLSTYGDGVTPGRPRGLTVVDTHIDIIDWRHGRGFLGEEAALGLAVRHLAARRAAGFAATAPTGLLTHHRVHDEDAWAFVEAFLGHLATHPGARILGAAELFAPGGVGAEGAGR